MAKAKPRGGAKKKRGTAKRRTKLIVPGDPPIIVGGGGSAYVWVKLGQGQTPVNPSLNHVGIGIKPGAPVPANRGNYSCSRLNGAPPSVFFYSGEGEEQELEILDSRTWYIRVE